MPLPRYQRQVEPTLAPVTQAQPDPGAGQGLAFAGQALDQASKVASAIALDIRQKQIVADVSKGMADFQTLAGNVLADAKARRGDDALKTIPIARKSLQEALQRTGASIQDEEARAQYQRQAEELVSRFQLDLTSHELVQTREKIQTDAAAGHVAAVNNAAVLWDNQDALDTLISQDVARLYLTGDTAAEKQAKAFVAKQEIVASAAKAGLDAYDQGNLGALDRVTALVYANKDALGARFSELQASIAKAGFRGQADTKAAEIEAQLRTGPDGFVDTSSMQDRLDAIADPRLKAATEDRLRERVTLATSAEKGLVSTVSDIVQGAYNKDGLAAAQRTRLQDGRSAWDWLNVHDPDKVRQIQDHAYTRWKQSQADSRESVRELHDAREKAKNDFLALPPDMQATINVDSEFGLVTDAVGLSNLKRLQRGAITAAQNGELVKLQDFVRDGLSAAQPLGFDKDKTATLQADLAQRWYDFRDDNKRAPNFEESTALQAGAITKQDTRTKVLGIPIPGTGVNQYGFERSAKDRAQAARSGSAAPLPPTTVPSGPTVVERRRAPDGRLLEKLSDGTIRVAQ